MSGLPQYLTLAPVALGSDAATADLALLTLIMRTPNWEHDYSRRFGVCLGQMYPCGGGAVLGFLSPFT